MSTRPPDDDGDFGQQKDAQILPLHSSERRRRTSGKRLVDTPAPVQDWFDANARGHASDVRLQVWLEEGLRDAALAADATDPADHRQQISGTRLTEHPILIQEWFDATADAPNRDLRLRLFVDALAPPAAVQTSQTTASVDQQLAARPAVRPPASAGPRSPKAAEPRSRHRWLISAGLALAASTLLTVGLQQQAALRSRSPLASSPTLACSDTCFCATDSTDSGKGCCFTTGKGGSCEGRGVVTSGRCSSRFTIKLLCNELLLSTELGRVRSSL